MCCTPGIVRLYAISLSLMTGSHGSAGVALVAESLYTPPSDGCGSHVASFVPTPNESMGAPCAKSDWMVYSSRSFDTEIFT